MALDPRKAMEELLKGFEELVKPPSDVPLATNSTTLEITAKAQDVRTYNVNMSELDEKLAPFVAECNGNAEIGPGAEGKPSLLVQFNDVASANAFIKRVNNEVAKLPAFSLKPLA